MTDLRPATPDDATELARVFLDCWHISYSEIMPASLVERMTAERALTLWRDALSGDVDAYVVAVNEEESPTGFIGYRMTGADTGYVSSLYVSPYAQGGGYGRRLLARAEEELRTLGATRAYLWVFEQNEPSRRFYERSGWSLDGTRETLAEWGEPQVGMSKSL